MDEPKKSSKYGNLKPKTRKPSAKKTKTLAFTAEDAEVFAARYQLQKRKKPNPLFNFSIEIFYQYIFPYLTQIDIYHFAAAINEPQLKHVPFCHDYFSFYFNKLDYLSLLPAHTPLDQQGQEFIQRLPSHSFSTLPHVDWFNPIVIRIKENPDEVRHIFLPFLMLRQMGRQDILDAIYLQQYDPIKIPFGFNLDLPLEPDDILATWAICTYQSLEEFKKHINGAPVEILLSLLWYACYCHNYGIVKHLCTTLGNTIDNILFSESGDPEKLECIRLVAENGGFGERGCNPEKVITTLKDNTSSFWSKETKKETQLLINHLEQFQPFHCSK